MHGKRIVITGVGILSSLGHEENMIVDNILKRNTNPSNERVRVDGEYWESFFIHKLRNANIVNTAQNVVTKLNGVDKFSTHKSDKDLQYFLTSIYIALKDGNLTEDKLSTSKTSLVLAHENPGLGSFFDRVISESYKFFKNSKRAISKLDLINGLYDKCKQNAYDSQTFMYLFYVAKAFGIHEYSVFLNNACASGVFALETARRQIVCGNSSIAIVSAVDHPDVYKYLWFKKKGMYSKNGLSKPFSQNSEGIVFGEGGAALILEDLHHAKKRNAKIYAEYLGSGVSLDSWKVTLPDIMNKHYYGAFQSALRNSNINAEKIDFINPHGVGLKITDQHEARTIAEIFKNNKIPLISAYKPLVGHNLGGSALLETALLMLSLKRNIIFPTVNSEPLLKGLKIKVITDAVKKKMNIVAKMTCGFGGFNGVAIFKKISD